MPAFERRDVHTQQGGHGRLCLVPGPLEPVTMGVRLCIFKKFNKNIKKKKILPLPVILNQAKLPIFKAY
jgi:hypothetical protein